MLPSGRKLGNRKASYNPKRLWLAKYINRSVVSVPATVPLDLSTSLIVKRYPWIMTGMFANGPDAAAPALIAANGIGDCFWAASARRAAYAAASVGKVLWTSYTDMLKAVLQGYASTGWDITQTDAQGNNPTDQGTDPTQGFAFLQSTGLLCSDGTYAKILGTIGVNPADFAELLIGFNISGGNFSLGINFPAAWDSAPIWDVTNSPNRGGHEIPGFSDLSITSAGLKIDSWGEQIIITAGGIAQQGTQATIVIDGNTFGPGSTNVAGFDQTQMLADIQAAP